MCWSVGWVTYGFIIHQWDIITLTTRQHLLVHQHVHTDVLSTVDQSCLSAQFFQSLKEQHTITNLDHAHLLQVGLFQSEQCRPFSDALLFKDISYLPRVLQPYARDPVKDVLPAPTGDGAVIGGRTVQIQRLVRRSIATY